MHPLMTILARARVRAGLRAKGISLRRISEVIDSVDDDAIQWAADSTATPLPVFDDTGHPILDAIIAFLSSPQGAALIDALIKLILSMLA